MAVFMLPSVSCQLNRRSNNYSSRKPLVYAGRYRSKDKRLVLMRYGDEMRKQRAAFHTIMQTSGEPFIMIVCFNEAHLVHFQS